MLSCLVLITIGIIALANACSKDRTFGAGHITDIKLDSSESQALIVKINNGIYDYCRSLNVQTGEISFEEISCTKNELSFEEIPNYDIEVSPNGDLDDIVDEAAFMALNATDKTEIITDRDDTNLTVTIGVRTEVLLLEDIFIHPFYFAYFYAPSMKTLFILTADQNETASDPDLTIDALTKIHLVTISWNPEDGETSDFPADLTDFEYGQQNTVNTNGFVGDANPTDPDADFTLLLDGQLWRTYDADDMFMLEVTSIISTCDKPDWLRYKFIDNIYNLRKNGQDGGANATFLFDHIGKGYMGIDTRLKRAYAFTDHTVSYYQAINDEFESFSEELFEFDHSELSSYWVLMWFLIALFICCCCCGCACYFKKKRDKQNAHQNRFGMTAEQEMMTQV